MAEFTTFIFPIEKSHMPSDESIERACAYLEDVYLCDFDVLPQKHAKTKFLDSGSAFWSYLCPACGTTVKKHGSEDSEDLWDGHNWRSLSSEEQTLTVACCKANVNFKDLGVSDRTGFAVFHFEIEGAGEDFLPNEEQLSQIGELLGCKARSLVAVLD